MAAKTGKILGNYDEFDFLILKELRDNAKIPIRSLAKKTGLHPNTLLQRIKKLENGSVIIKYSVDIDYSKLGYDLHAIIFLKLTHKAHMSWHVAKELGNIPEVLALYSITGDYDAVAIVKTKNNESLARIIQEMGKRDYVINTYTNVVLYAYKHSYEFNPFNGMMTTGL
ncbi:TPA: Lrp/AsnC family transcriptional regulator [Candidatus Micrarchaeota archaeon]|nr:Lrp/AsnC family transcriptional regulator [Candidatus Micrarchaeota archaeon]